MVLLTFAANAQKFLNSFYEIEKSWWTIPRGDYKIASEAFLEEGLETKSDFQIGLGKYLLARYYSNYDLPTRPSVWESFEELPFVISAEAKEYFIKSNQTHFISLLEGLRIKGSRQAQHWESAFDAMHRMDSISLTHENNYVKGYAYYRKAQMLSGFNQYQEALSAYYLAEQSFSKGGFIGYSGVCHIHIANINSSLGQVKKAIEHYSKVQRVVNQTGALHIANFACYGRFGLYIQLKDYDKAKEITDSIVILEKKLKAIPNFNLRNIHLSSVYQGKGDFEKAKGYIESSLKIIRIQYANQYPYQHMGNLHFKKGNLENKLGNIDEAKNDYHLAIKYSSLAKNLALKENVFVQLSKLYQKSEELDSAFYFLEQSKVMGDSVLSSTSLKQIALLEAYYKNDALQNEKELLQSELEVSELKGKYNLVGLIAIAFVLTFSIVLIVLVYSKRSLKQKNNILLFKEKLFRSQMNPHFIFNVLNAVQYSILQSDKREAVSSLTKFGRLIRDVLEGSREEFIGLDRELRIIENYLSVQQNRLSNSFEFKLDVKCDLELDEINVPPMLLQPVIENSIEHGFKNMNSGGFLEISIHQKDDKVFFSIKDNGKGIDLSSGNEHDSVALKITKDRLKLFNSSDLKIKSKVDEGVFISYSIPINI